MNAVQVAVASVRSKTPNGIGGGHGGQVVKIRERHHGIARLLVAGIPDEDICRSFGLSPRRLDLLRNQTPAFQELMAYYEKKGGRIASAVETYIDVLERNMIGAELEIAERLAEAPDDLTVSELHKIARDAADRLGFSKRTVNFNMNADFATVLEQARRRSEGAKALPREGTASGPLLEAVALPAPGVGPIPRLPAQVDQPIPGMQVRDSTPNAKHLAVGSSFQGPDVEVTPTALELHSRQVAAKALGGEPPPARAVLRRI